VHDRAAQGAIEGGRVLEFHELEALVGAAASIDTATLVLVLLGANAGLRKGEILALRWCDVDRPRRLLHVRQAIWRGKVTLPKSGKGRDVELTGPLFDALERHRKGARGDRVLGDATEKYLRAWMMAAQERANLPATGRLHVLRHTFCSHLAMRGAPVGVIRELAGHSSLVTTLRYMHLSPSVRARAVRLLEKIGEAPLL
jgi:integrase